MNRTLVSLEPTELPRAVCDSCGCVFELTAHERICDGCRASDADDDRAAELVAVVS